MRYFKLLSNPYTLIICFLFIIISGEHWGGFYVFYILMALPFGGMHALLAIVGIAILLISYYHFIDRPTISKMLNLLGLFLLFASLYYFFSADKKHYNYGTFEQTVPFSTMVLTALVAVFFLVGSFFRLNTKENVI